MPYNHPHQVIAFHSCNQKVGLSILNGDDELLPSRNKWDWLGHGIYFWEENPTRALEYAEESAKGLQFNKVQIEKPFVLGAIIELGNCLNLVESNSLKIVKEAYKILEKISKEAGDKMPANKGSIKTLDCAVFQYIHYSNQVDKKPAYDTIRCAFQEGNPVYSTSDIYDRLHMQICVINPDAIKGYFLPRPVDKYNPYFKLTDESVLVS